MCFWYCLRKLFNTNYWVSDFHSPVMGRVVILLVIFTHRLRVRHSGERDLLFVLSCRYNCTTMRQQSRVQDSDCSFCRIGCFNSLFRCAIASFTYGKYRVSHSFTFVRIFVSCCFRFNAFLPVTLPCIH